MRGQVVLATAAVILIITLLLLTTLPKRTIGPLPEIDDKAIAQREVLYMLKTAVEEAATKTALEKIYDVENQFRESIINILKKKIDKYGVIRGVWCNIEDIRVKKREVYGNKYRYAYINETYVQLLCTDGIVAAHYASVDVEIELRNLGITYGIKTKFRPKVGNEPVYIINFGAVLHNGSIKMPLLGGFREQERIWLFNTSNTLEMRVAIPPEYCIRNEGYNITIIAATPGQGVATLAILHIQGMLCS
ncbi:MAG: hypothetical protein QXH63_05410 [Pyrobaculum sp.]